MADALVKGWLSPWAMWDKQNAEYRIQDDYEGTGRAPRWTFPSVNGRVVLGTVDVLSSDGSTIAATVDHTSGIVVNSWVYNDYGTLVTSQEYKALYARYNVRSTTPGNPAAEVTGIEGVAASYIADEALTLRGGYFRTYIDPTVGTETIRTSVGCEISARASYSGGTELEAEGPGTAFVGARIWMAPYYTAATLANINNFWGLWIYGEHATQRNADSAIKISDAGGGFTADITFQEGTTLTDDGTSLTLAGAGFVIGTAATGLSFTGTYTGNVIDFSSATIAPTGSNGPCLIRAGTYASPVDLGADQDQSGMIRLYSTTSAGGTSYDRTIFACAKTTNTKGVFPISGLAEINAIASGNGPTQVGAAQFIAHMNSATAKLDARSAAGWANFYGAWLKVTSEVGAVAASGSVVAPLWLDNQMNGTVSGEEYACYITSGTPVDAVFGFEATGGSGGWTQLFYFDSTCSSLAPISSTSLKVLLDTTQYYIPLSTTAGQYTGNLGAITAEGAIGFSGTFTVDCIDFSSVAINHTGSNGPCFIRAGTYAAPVANADEDQSGMIRLYGETSADGTSYDRGVFVCLKTTGTKGIFPIAGLAEVLAQGGAGPNKVQAAQFICDLHTTDAVLAGLGGDSTAGMYGGWFKITAIDGATCSATARAAPIWLDNQLYGANAAAIGEEYTIFSTTGGTKPTAWAGFETTSSGWTNFLSFDETSYDQDPVVASGCDVAGAGASEAYLRVNLNGTEYGIPLIAI